MNTTILIRVKVTSKHIEDGLRSEPFTCPIALAIKEYFPERKVAVAGESAYIFTDDLDQTHEGVLSPEAEQFIYDFDAVKCVDPFEFDLELHEAAA